MDLYLDLKKAVAQGITREKASYAARVQIGVEADGSPMYRYFKTKEAYDKYREKHGQDKEDKGDKKDKKDSLKEKVDNEHKESVRKIKNTAYESKKKFEKETKKSIRIYLDE